MRTPVIFNRITGFVILLLQFSTAAGNVKNDNVLEKLLRELNDLQGDIQQLQAVRREEESVTLSITVDNDILELYIDGERYQFDAGEWPVTRQVPFPADAVVVAVHGADRGGWAGLLASTSDNRLVTDNSWRCTTKPKDVQHWFEISYDDASWPVAVVAASHSSSDIHGILQGISTRASWIWTSRNGYGGSGLDSDVYCRVKLSQSITLSITADNDILDLYVDGKQYQVTRAEWTVTRQVQIPTKAKIVAVHCADRGGWAGLLASTFDDRLITNSSWKCITKPKDLQHWMDISFDDSSWPIAVVGAPHSSKDIHGILPSISTRASWIWTSRNGYGNTGTDSEVYCRSSLLRH